MKKGEVSGIRHLLSYKWRSIGDEYCLSTKHGLSTTFSIQMRGKGENDKMRGGGGNGKKW